MNVNVTVCVRRRTPDSSRGPITARNETRRTPTMRQKSSVLTSPSSHPTTPPAKAANVAAVWDKIEAAQRRRLERETAGAPQRKEVVGSAIEMVQEAARREEKWRAGAAERAAAVHEQPMAQLAEAEAEAAAERALEAARCAAAEGCAAVQKEAEARQRVQVDAEAQHAAKASAADAALDPFGTLWTNDRRPVTTPAAAGSSRRQLQGMSHVGNSIENGNRLGERPVVRQSKLYRQNESGNAMKAALGHDELKWETDALQGVFAGQGLYDAESNSVIFKAKTQPPHATMPTPHPKSQSPSLAANSGGAATADTSIARDEPPALGALQQAAAARKAKLYGARSTRVGEVAASVSYRAPSAALATAPSALERMQLVKSLLDDGFITQMEFDAKRAAILDAL